MATRGRPKKEEARKSTFLVRLSDEDMKMLEYASEKTGKTKAEIVRDGIRAKYNLAKYS